MVEALSDDPAIEIAVTDPMIKDAGLSKHTIYNVKGMDRIGQFDTYRRYNDFLALREYLLTKWPGCYIPPIPGKEFGSGNDDQVV